jgi:hypothetical protein
MQGAPIAVGHADLAFTMRTYVHAQAAPCGRRRTRYNEWM